MKVLLILVAVPEIKTRENIIYPIMTPPLTLTLLYSVCKKASHDVSAIDIRFFMENKTGEWLINYDKLNSYISKCSSNVVGISFLSSSAIDGFEVARICKMNKKTVIGGGKHASAAIREFTESGWFDYVIVGDGEESFPKLLQEIEDREIPFFTEKTIVINAETCDPHIIPPVSDLSLYNEIYKQFDNYRSVYIETSRGCCKGCGFCQVSRSGSAWSPLRKLPIENALKTIDFAVSEQNVNYVIIADSIATIQKDHFIYFIKKFSKKFKNIKLQFNSSVDMWSEDVAILCKNIPCSVWFGFESGSQRVLDFIKKGTTCEQAYNAANLCKKYNIPCAFNILLGLPTENENDYIDTMDMILKCDWVYPNPNIFNPLLGTSLYDYCYNQNLLINKNDYSIWDADRIAKTGRGVINNIDYEKVLKYYFLFSELQGEEKRSLLKK